jgi:hypothetical protein
MFLFQSRKIRSGNVRYEIKQKIRKETSICRICLEPIYNFICPNCLKKSIKKWIDFKDKSLLDDFENFHHKLTQLFSTEENVMFCIKCKKIVEIVMCPYCYAKEVFWWLFDKDIRLAKKFAKLFNFDFLNVGYLPTIELRNLEPIIITTNREKIDINICEKCGMASDNIKQVNDQWICEMCREEEE